MVLDTLHLSASKQNTAVNLEIAQLKILKKLPLEQVEILVLILAWVLLVSIFGFFGSIFFGIHELGDNFPFVTSRIVMIGV